MTDTWRVILTPAASAAKNMAIDEAFSESTSQKTSPPTLRLYSWEKPSLSLGYAQSVHDVDLENLSLKQWQLVRRPTGGRAILHTDELTYSITAPVTNPLVAGSVLTSYQRISVILQRALEILGIQTSADKEYEIQSSVDKIDPVCFKVPSNFEITWQGKKLIGSAQARRSNGVLQHGSFPLYGDLTRINEVLRYPNEETRTIAKQKLLDHATTLEIAASKIIPFETVAEAIVEAFKHKNQIELIKSNPTPQELLRADMLEQTKYATNNWNHRI